jgi:large subunit ribosomal protein L10
MDREQKEAAVAELTESLKGAETIFAVDYRGISVTRSAELRRRLTEAEAVFRVVKNRLAKRAVADAGTEELDELLVGPTALTLVHGDPVIAAKAISTIARGSQALQFKGGVMEGERLDPEAFAELARLPGVDVLRGQLVGVTASPITGLARGLGSMLSGLAVALGQIAEQGLVAGEEPEAEAEEAPAEQAEEPEAEEESEAPAEAAESEEPEAEAEEGPAEQADEPEAQAEEAPAEQPEEPEAQAEEESEEPAAEAEEESEAPEAEAEEASAETADQPEPEAEEESEVPAEAVEESDQPTAEGEEPPAEQAEEPAAEGRIGAARRGGEGRES